jgi:hypothetical protein
VVVGGAWPLLMALTPAADRPWISGTADNSIWSLIFGYNGLGRLSGQAGGPQAFGGGGGPGSLFGGPTGPLRLVQASLGGQGGWLLGFAVVAIGAGLVATRVRRSDPATGWIIGVGGAFATTAVAFSFASGIFHPYYVSALAPFTAALVGAGCAYALAGGLRGRIAGPLAVGAGALSVLAVAHDVAGVPGWTSVLVLVVAVPAAVALAFPGMARAHRRIALAVGLAALLAAPAAWSVQTLGHATNGTFPAGGPSAQGIGMGGPGGGRTGGLARFGGAPPGAAAGGPPAGAFGGRAGGGAGALAGAGGGAAGTGGAGGLGGGPGGGIGGPGGRGDSTAQLAAVTYARAHGGGTIATSSQNSTSAQVVAGADIAAIGGFSGRESQVSATWLADAVQQGRIRWVLADSGGGAGGRGGAMDSRTGSSDVTALVRKVCTSTTSSGLYDCAGQAGALASGG